VPTELDVLRIVSERLAAGGWPFMLTGSFAMAHYATPRMTRDLDLVVELQGRDVERLVAAFSDAFYIDGDDARTAVATERLFNLMHYGSGIKVDLIVRKSEEFRRVEFGRRLPISLGGVPTWIASREDLILSKLVWARDAGSELQRRDVVALLAAPGLDETHLRHWAPRLGVSNLLEELWH
jgi:hypothetical protein